MFYGICGVMDTSAYVSRGMGKTVVPMIITLVFVCVVRIIWVFTIFKVFNTAECVYWSYPITWALAIIGQLTYFAIIYRGKIKKQSIST